MHRQRRRRHPQRRVCCSSLQLFLPLRVSHSVDCATYYRVVNVNALLLCPDPAWRIVQGTKMVENRQASPKLPTLRATYICTTTENHPHVLPNHLVAKVMFGQPHAPDPLTCNPPWCLPAFSHHYPIVSMTPIIPSIPHTPLPGAQTWTTISDPKTLHALGLAP